jgi:hypothetical protein
MRLAGKKIPDCELLVAVPKVGCGGGAGRFCCAVHQRDAIADAH